MQARDVWRIFSAALVIGVAMSIAAVFVLDGRYASGVATGAFLGVFNIYGLIRLGQRLVAERPGPRATFVRFAFKYGGMALIIVGAFFVLDVEPLGFLVGVGNVLLAIGAYSVGLLGHSPEEPEANDSGKPT